MRKLLLILLLCSACFGQVRVPLTSFNAGELSPYLQMRSDFTKYQNGCKTLTNMIPLSQGPVMRRPGTYYIAEVKDSNDFTRLIPFEYSTTDAYILEFGDLYMRVYRNGGQIQDPNGTENLTSPIDLSSYIVAHWKLNDNAANTTVIDADGATHNGTASANTSLLHVTGMSDGAFDMDGQYYVTVADHADFTFDDSADEAFSIMAWAYVQPNTSVQQIIDKFDPNTSDQKREWSFSIAPDESLYFIIYDETNNAFQVVQGKNAISEGWHFLVATYDGRGGSSAYDGMNLYVDSVLIGVYESGDPSYSNMRNTASEVFIGAQLLSNGTTLSFFWQDKLDNIAIFSKELTTNEIDGLYDTSGIYELTTTYTTSEVDELQYVQLADTMYITHPDHEPRKLTRTGHAAWAIADVNYTDGPFQSENIDTTITVTPSGTTGTITIDANDDIFSASMVGSLIKIRHPRTDSTLNGILDANESSSAIDCEGDYKFVTHGTWTATVKLERTVDGTNYETVYAVNSANDTNIDYAGSEADSGYQYRVTMTSRTSGSATYSFIVYDHMHTGVARIATYVDPNEVTATVHTELGGTTATSYWSEGYWSPKNGYPRTIAFHEFRLWYGGNSTYPQTIWSTKADDYEKMDEGDGDDDDAMIYLLPGQNPIQWMLSHTYLMIGTLGGAGRLGEQDESMTPNTQPQYFQQARYGSEYKQALLAGDAILYLERGGTKVREFVYNLERDKFLAPDMTILAEHITGDGITDMAFQSRPESILWGCREDGRLLSMTYNREQDVVSWASHILGGSGEAESIAIISGADEDENWLIVKRTINSLTRRYVERMKPWDWGTDDTDVFFVDSGLTWDGGTAYSISDINNSDVYLTITSSNLNDDCGDDGSHTVEEALDGTDYWRQVVTETHYLVLDLGQTYNVSKIKGRSNAPYDPTAVNIYVSDSNSTFGTADYSNITTWQDTDSFIEIDLTNEEGRYVKVEITDTEESSDFLNFGFVAAKTILDVAYCHVTITCSGHPFSNGDQIKFTSVGGSTELNGNIYTVADATATTFALKDSTNTNYIDGESVSAYTSGGTVQAFENTFTGFGHLEGETIAICSDGIADTNETVSSGSFTADTWSNKMHAGLAYTSNFETMPVSLSYSGGDLFGQYKDLSLVDINFYKTMGTKYGIEGDLYDIPFGQTSLFTDWIDLSYQFGRRRDCSIYIQQTDPLPLMVRAMVLTVEIPR